MKRAVELFTFETRSSSSPFVTETWHTQSEPDTADFMISAAASQWEIVVTRQAAAVWVTVRGPETKAGLAPIPKDAEFFGIHFSHGTFMPILPLPRLVDRSMTLPPASRSSFWLDGSAWELPEPDNADVFVDRLVRAGLLVHDPVASAALYDDVEGLSTRSVERRVARATGLTRGTIRQIHRAERAVELLGRGVPPLEVARQAGYADQPHMTRWLKRLVGQTPSQIGAHP
jgi:AraC-like DNA-binding protein